MSSGSPQRATIGKYEILSVLGRGGMGVVYKARDPHIDRIVAIKTIATDGDQTEEDLLSRLRQEARSAGRLHHPHIVTIFDFGHDDGLAYIVMEFVEGLNLARIIEQSRPLALTTKIDLLVQIASGLDYAHKAHVLHRDMKPGNVCVTTTGTAKILDFGLARMDDTRLTKTGFMVGTIAYMSPERLNGATSAQDDIFALGAIAYELLTYTRPFPGTSAPEVMQKILSNDAPPPPSAKVELPGGLDRIVMKALSKNAAERYQSAAEFGDDLCEISLSEEFSRFVSDPVRASLLDAAIAEFEEKHGSTGNAYASPSGSRKLAEPSPTVRVRAERSLRDFGTTSAAKTVALQKETEAYDSNAPDTLLVDRTSTSEKETVLVPTDPAAPTPVVAARRHSSPRKAIVAAAVVVAALGLAAMAFLRTPAAEEPQSHDRTPAPAVIDAAAQDLANPVAVSAADQEIETAAAIQLTTARSLHAELTSRRLSSGERLKLAEAGARAELAGEKFEIREYDAARQLAASAIASMQSLLESSDRNREAASDPGPAKRRAPAAVAQVPSPRPAVVAAPAAVAPPPAPLPAPKPAPVAETSAAPPPVAPEHEIRSFIARLASAYQAKDAEFFRTHSLRYNDQLAAAIRNSPSTRVSIEVMNIEFPQPQHATVSVRRTDTFADASARPATQALVYNLQRTAGDWKIVSMKRQ